jgi:hypothetical protein
VSVVAFGWLLSHLYIRHLIYLVSAYFSTYMTRSRCVIFASDCCEKNLSFLFTILSILNGPSFLKLRTLDAFPPSWHHDAVDNHAWDPYAHPVSQPEYYPLIVVGLEVDTSTFAGFTRYITGIGSYYSACLPVWFSRPWLDSGNTLSAVQLVRRC